MIIGIFHQGSGLGNQLHRYVATRVKAADLSVDWGMMYIQDGSGKEEGFKGNSFMNIKPTSFYPKDVQFFQRKWNEKKVVENGVDIRSYDPEWNFVEDNTIIDGEFQDERYWEHREDEVRKWLKVEPYPTQENICLICFRGGEYSVFSDLFLTKEYWQEAVELMKKERPDMKFIVVTDDYETAKEFFPDFDFMDDLNGAHDMGVDWRATRYAKYLILSNASFYILPAWLNENAKKIIAPRYWARHNTKVWALSQNYYKHFFYI